MQNTDAAAARQRRRDFEPGAARHLDVEEHQVGRQARDALHRLLAVLGLADDLHVGHSASSRRSRSRAGASSSTMTARIIGQLPRRQRDVRGSCEGTASRPMRPSSRGPSSRSIVSEAAGAEVAFEALPDVRETVASVVPSRPWVLGAMPSTVVLDHDEQRSP